MDKIKDIDKKLLNLLQKGDMCVPRITKLAHELGLPTSTVQTKIEKFKKEGVIKEYSAILDPEKVDKSLVAFWFGKTLKGGSDKEIESVPNKLKKIPQVQDVFFVSGEWDFVIKARLRDHKEYYEVARQLVKNYEEQSGMGMIAPKCFKDSHKIIVD